MKPDDGEIRVQGGVASRRLAQEVPHGAQGGVFDVVAAGTGRTRRAARAVPSPAATADPVDTDALARVQAKIEARHGW